MGQWPIQEEDRGLSSGPALDDEAGGAGGGVGGCRPRRPSGGRRCHANEHTSTTSGPVFSQLKDTLGNKRLRKHTGKDIKVTVLVMFVLSILLYKSNHKNST